MTPEAVLSALLLLCVLFAIAWIGKWAIESFFPEPVRTPALLLMGVILLIVLVLYLLRMFPGLKV